MDFQISLSEAILGKQLLLLVQKLYMVAGTMRCEVLFELLIQIFLDVFALEIVNSPLELRTCTILYLYRFLRYYLIDWDDVLAFVVVDEVQILQCADHVFFFNARHFANLAEIKITS